MVSMRSWSGAALGRRLTPGTKTKRAEQDFKTPMSPPGSDKEEPEESEEADESESKSEQGDEEEVGV
jgi:hypothetical protein